MSKFLEGNLGSLMTDEPLVDTPPVDDQPPVDTPPSDEPPIDTPPVDDVPPVDEPPVDDEPVVVEKKKVIVDLDTYLQTNQDLVLKVLKEKSTDYSAISNEDALKLKLAKENPEWSAEDVADELKDRYGVGLQKVAIDLETMDADEVKEAEAQNKKIDAANRLLKKEGSLAKTELAEAIKDLKLPELEYEVEADAQDIDAILSERVKQGQEAIEKSRDEVWIPALNEAFKVVDTISEEVAYEADGVANTLKVDLALTAEDKASIVTELANYQATASDNKYLDEQGNVDYASFVKDKSEVLARKKMYAAIAKQAAEKAKQDFIRNDMVNYSSGVRNVSSPSDDTTDMATAIWKTNKQKK